MGILTELNANVDPVKSVMYVACRRSGCMILVVHRHWEGITEVNKLCVGIEPVGLALLVVFNLGQILRKPGLVSAALVSASGPPSAGRCSCALNAVMHMLSC